MTRWAALAVVLLVGAGACTNDRREGLSEMVVVDTFGVLPSGEMVEEYTFRNANGVEVAAISYGGIITRLVTPDRNGQRDDIVLGYDDLDGYLTDSPYFGAIVGRYANRIAVGQFTIDGATYELARNDGPNHLHGGVRGFDKVVWSGTPIESDSGVGVEFTYVSPDGDEGYPGTLTVHVRYVLTADDRIVIDYQATTDRATPVNLSQHSYFNLGGHAGGISGVLDHVLTIPAGQFTPVDGTLIPTGELASVEGTPLDFREATPIGARIDSDHEQIGYGRGYDHNFVLGIEQRQARAGLMLAARVEHPVSGRTLEIHTTEPGIQFYSGNFLDGSIVGKGGSVYAHRTGFCLETQHFPDSPHQAGFPSTILRPGAEYRSRTVWVFGNSAGRAAR